jgi:hypothetical protein
MAMPIAMPTEHDLASLPIVDITSTGLWVPSDHNETNFGFSFMNTNSEFIRNAQTFTTDTLENERFFDSQSTHPEDQPVSDDDDTAFYDACDDMATKAFHLSIDYDKIIDSETVDSFLGQLDYAELRGDHEEFDTFAFGSCAAIQDQAEWYVDYLGYRPIDVIRKTLERTSQLATTILQFLMRRHIKSRFPHLNRNRLRETVATDTYFANVRALGGATCAQVFYGLQSHMINVYGMKTESEMPDIYQDFICDEGAPNILRIRLYTKQKQCKTELRKLDK